MYNKIVNKLLKLPTDKYLHFIVSMIGLLLLSCFTSSIWIILLMSLIVLCIGVIKEVIDLECKNNFDITDIYADICGTISGLFIRLLYLI